MEKEPIGGPHLIENPFVIEETQWYKSCYVTKEKMLERSKRDDVHITYQVHHSEAEVRILFEKIFPKIGNEHVFQFYYERNGNWWQFEFLSLAGKDTSFARMMGIYYERFILSQQK